MHALRCYRCGASLAKYTLPLSRRDQCPDCQVDLHVCLLCTNYDPRKHQACAEDDALEVRDKAQANFCDYFSPSEQAYAPGRMSAHEQAERKLDTLFGAKPEATRAPSSATDAAADDDAPLLDAEALFKD